MACLDDRFASDPKDPRLPPMSVLEWSDAKDDAELMNFFVDELCEYGCKGGILVTLCCQSEKMQGQAGTRGEAYEIMRFIEIKI